MPWAHKMWVELNPEEDWHLGAKRWAWSSIRDQVSIAAKDAFTFQLATRGISIFFCSEWIIFIFKYYKTKKGTWSSWPPNILCFLWYRKLFQIVLTAVWHNSGRNPEGATLYILVTFCYLIFMMYSKWGSYCMYMTCADDWCEVMHSTLHWG